MIFHLKYLWTCVVFPTRLEEICLETGKQRKKRERGERDYPLLVKYSNAGNGLDWAGSKQEVKGSH